MNKKQECWQLYKQTSLASVTNKDNWLSLLDSMSRLYKYEFSEQVLIHAQNPKATACANSKIWNNAMHRYIKSGSKGIAVVDYSKAKAKINYVFDVNDTQEAWHKNAKPKLPTHWQIDDEQSLVVEWKKTGLQGDTLSGQINERIRQLIRTMRTDSNYQDIINPQAIFSSISYVVHRRCGLETSFSDRDFKILQTEDASIVDKFGFIISTKAQELLREIEGMVKQQERTQEHGNQVQTRGGLSDSRPSDERATRSTLGQVWHGTQELFEERTPDAVQLSLYDNGTIPPLSRSRDTSQGTARNSHEATRSKRPNTRQSDEANRVDSAHEQLESASRGNHLQRDNSQLLDAKNNKIDTEQKESKPLSFSVLEEPYIVIEWSESPYFQEGEILLFHEADEKFKLVERYERAERINQNGSLGGYHKTSGVIHLKTETGESTYEFRYDIGDYDENKSGLYNHIHGYWTSQKEKAFPFVTKEDVALGLQLAEELKPYQSEFDYSTPIIEPVKYKITTEPYVIIQSTESPYFDENEILLFHEADSQFKLAEISAHNNQHTDKHQNVIGTICYTNPTDETISNYEFNYVISPFDENKSGLYHHIHTLLSENGADDKQLIDILKPYQGEFDYSAHMVENQNIPFEKHDAVEIHKTLESPTNYHITDDFTSESSKRKCAQNIEAITLLKEIENESRMATANEQDILALYVGWGGMPQVFDTRSRFWKQEYESLKTLLSPEEYEQARASTLNAHYTSPIVIKSMYQAVEQMGFTGGKVLEPALGTGHFFGTMPESIVRNCELHGIELDPLTARMAKQLYPNAHIQNTGFEKTEFQDNSFDLVIGNVPFGSYAVMDTQSRSLNALNANIHDYFIAKSLDKVRSNGVVAVITSKGTMDKANPKIRRYFAQHAELLGAIRLPNNAFEHAKTEVTSDILFFQKREQALEIEAVENEAWIHVAVDKNGIPINAYFIEHPEMILGEMTLESGQYGQEATCKPFPDANLKEQLQEAITNIQTEAPLEYVMDDSELEENDEIVILAYSNIRPYSYCIHDDEVYFKKTSTMSKVEFNSKDENRMKQLILMRDCVNELIQAQVQDCDDSELQTLQAKLNQQYDTFSAEYGRINERSNKKLFDEDSSYYLLCSLEVQNEDEQFKCKSDIFSQRSIGAKKEITHTNNAYDALIVSMTKNMNVDMAFMQQLTGSSAKQIERDLQSIIFREIPTENQAEPSFVTADAYLSGNVVERLSTLKSFLQNASPEEQALYAQNVLSLEQAQPKYLHGDKIMANIGTTWIPMHYYTEFMHETFETAPNLRSMIQVNFERRSGEWAISNKKFVSYNDVAAYTKYGIAQQNAYFLLENTLNLKTPTIYKTVDDRKVVDEKATVAIQQKQEELQQVFQTWLWNEPERRHALETLYNQRFNQEVPRKYNGEFISFDGMNPTICLRDHQKDAVARTIFGGNSLLAHEVGAGKTYEIIASAIESKRLGLCSKSVITVLNSTVEDFATAALTLYPSKNILVVREKDFKKENRKKFCARIATGDYDAVIMAHSQFEKIAMSKDYQTYFIENEIETIIDDIQDIRVSARDSNEKRFSIKKLENMKKSLQHRLEKLSAEDKKDDVIDFESLGIDRLYVDESHQYKNLFYKTKMQGVAGLASSESQRAMDMFMKCRYLNDKTNGNGIVFATGTPLANSLVELYTNMRFLMYDKLEQLELSNFDAWVSTYAQVSNVMELAPEGNTFRVRQRLSKFFNLPELKNMFCHVADIKTKYNMNLQLPKVQMKNVLLAPSDEQAHLMENLLSRAKQIRNGSVKPDVDNMLKLTSDGKKIGLDARLMNEALPDNENSKVNACVENAVSLWKEHTAEKATQIIFCDTSTPKKNEFNLYDDLKAKLIRQGIPEKEIAFIHDAKSDLARKKLFAKMRSGSIRILIGSTQKCGTGVNVQNRLIATHDLDCPWRPIDLEQRLGRMERQGNMFKEVHCFRYVTEKTFDAYLWQTNEHKMTFISQIMTENSPLRECEDVNEATLEYSQIKALCVGDTRIQEVMELDMDIKKLQMLKSTHYQNQHGLQDKLQSTFPKQIARYKSSIEAMKQDEAMLAFKQNDAFSIRIGQKTFHKAKEAKEALHFAIDHAPLGDNIRLGNYKGMDICMHKRPITRAFSIKGAHEYLLQGDDISIGQIQRKLEDISPRIVQFENEVSNLYRQIEQAKKEKDQPFPQEAELTEKQNRKIELSLALRNDASETVLENEADEPETREPDEESEAKVSIFKRVEAIKLERLENGSLPKVQENER